MCADILARVEPPLQSLLEQASKFNLVFGYLSLKKELVSFSSCLRLNFVFIL